LRLADIVVAGTKDDFPEFVLPAFLRPVAGSASPGRYSASVTNICVVDKVLEKHGPSFSH
jgi:hypothetical protein